MTRQVLAVVLGLTFVTAGVSWAADKAPDAAPAKDAPAAKDAAPARSDAAKGKDKEAAKDSKAVPAKGPRIAVEPESFDFGKALQLKTLTKEFSVRNFGNEDLVIGDVSTTCGCTAAVVGDKVIKPGGSTPLHVELQTRSASGKLERTVLIRSNDTAKPILEVKIQAEVIGEAATP